MTKQTCKTNFGGRRGKRSSFCEPLRLSCFFRKCFNKIVIIGDCSTKNNANFQLNWAPYLYSGTLIVIFICLILMSLNVSLMWCILTLPWRSISAVHLVPPLTGNLGLGMRFVDCYFFATAVFLAQRKKKPGGTLIFHAFICYRPKLKSG